MKRYEITRVLQNETNGTAWKTTTHTTSKKRAEEMKKNFVCLGSTVTVLYYKVVCK